MSTKAQQQITTEAALKCAALVPASAGLGPIDFEPIILSAIERATELARPSSELSWEERTAQPQRSEQ